MAEFSDFIVFADESGDHGLLSIDPQFPVFALTFCLIRKLDYVEHVVPTLQRFKFDFWGHDGVVLHENEIRKSKGPFAFLRTDSELRASFYQRLNEIMEAAPIHIFASVIDKERLRQKYADPWNPYEIALLFCMERLLSTLASEGQEGKRVHVVFESRGKVEDDQLELEFRRICDNERNWGYKAPDFTSIGFEPIFLKKAVNSTGLQLADLTARPIAVQTIRPNQTNRAFELIQPKLRGMKSFP
jgi:hypothetical protein